MVKHYYALCSGMSGFPISIYAKNLDDAKKQFRKYLKTDRLPNGYAIWAN